MSLPAPHCCLSGSFSHSLALKCSLLLPTRGAGLSSFTALALAPLPYPLQTHCSSLIWVMSLPDTGSFVTTCKRACLSKFLGSSKRKQPQLIANHPKSLGVHSQEEDRLGVCVLPSCPSFLASQLSWTRFLSFPSDKSSQSQSISSMVSYYIKILQIHRK